MKKIKILIITLIVLLFVSTLLLLGFLGLTILIKNQRNCDWANIDNIELHAHIDVPKVLISDCSYDKNNNLKMAFFQLDTTQLDIERYIRFNNLKRISSLTQLETYQFLNLEVDTSGYQQYYIKTDSLNSEEYSKVLFEKKDCKLWVTINYQD